MIMMFIIGILFVVRFLSTGLDPKKSTAENMGEIMKDEGGFVPGCIIALIIAWLVWKLIKFILLILF